VVNAYDRIDNPAASAMGVKFISMDELLSTSDIISLHCPLTPDTFHLINDKTLKQTKPGVMIINTSRGGLIDAKAAIRGLKSKQIGYLGLDVYEEESDLFFRNLSEQVLQDDVFMRLESFPNVLITGHQAFFTDNALRNIAQTTADNLRDYAAGKPLVNQVLP
jgi:D-lactate dehydrogenase